MSKKTILSLVLTLLLTTIGSATTRNVPADYATIQDAIDASISALGNGDVILVADGTYKESIDLGSWDWDLTVRSASDDPNKCIIDCQGVGRGFYVHAYETETTVIRGFKIINGSADYGAGIECEGSSPTIENCIIEDCSADFGGAIDIFYGSPIIKDCVLRNNTSAFDGSAIECSGEDAMPTIENCLIYGNSNTSGYGALDFYDNCLVEIINCTIADNTGSDTYGGVYSTDSDISIRNSILWGNETSIGGVTVTASNCCVENGYSGTKNISKDPLFKTGLYGGYYLSQISAGQLADSNCVNAGDVNAANLFIAGETTNTYNNIEDINKVDLGYHYPASSSTKDFLFTIYASPSGYGTVDPNLPTGEYYKQYGEVKALAYPASGYLFMEWHYGNADTFNESDSSTYTVVEGPNNVLNLTIDSNTTVVGVFNTSKMYKVTTFVKSGYGVLETSPNIYPDANDPCSYYIPENTVAAIQANPSIGYVLKNWYIGLSETFDINDSNTYTVLAPTSNPLNLWMDVNQTVAAEFKYQTYLLTTHVDGGNGSISPKRGYYPAGTTVTLLATPDNGYRVASWVNGAINQPGWNTVTNTVLMDAAKDVNVAFELNTSTIIPVAAGEDIQNAIDKAKNGDILQLASGTYIGTGFDIDSTSNKAITILGDPENPENVVIDLSGEKSGGIYIESNNQCILNGLTITNGNFFVGNATDSTHPDEPGGFGGITYGAGLYLEGANHQILNCRISDISLTGGNGGDGADGNDTIVYGSYGGNGGWVLGAGVFVYSGSPAFKNCIIEDCCAIGGNGGVGGDGKDSDTDPTGPGGWGGLGGPAYGGGIACWTDSSPTFEKCIIRNCHAIGGLGGNGGDSGKGWAGAYGGLATTARAWNKNRNSGGTITDANGWGGLENSYVVNGTYNPWVSYLGNPFDTYSGNPADIDITDYDSLGGGVYVGRNCTVKFVDCNIYGNTSEGAISGLGGYATTGLQQQPMKNYHRPSYGSGVFCDKQSVTKFVRCEISSNEVIVTDQDETVVSLNDDYGGGSLATRDALWSDVNECDIFENFSPLGGGLYDYNCTDIHINDSNISNNYSYSGGGVMAIYSYGHIHNSIIRDNTAGTILDTNQASDYASYGSGGGIYAISSMIDINDSAIYDNAANSTGGGICITGYYSLAPTIKPTIHNCLITNNKAGAAGGGIAATIKAKPIIQNCTIADNSVTDIEGNGGGLYSSYSAEVTAKDNIIWNNVGILGSQIALSSGGAYTNEPAYLKVSYSDIDLNTKTGTKPSTSSSSSTATASRLVDSSTIYDEINTNGYAKVIVTLADVDLTTDWSSTASVSMLQNAVAYRQAKVLSTLDAGEFTLRFKMENTPIFSGTVTAAGLTSLLNNSLVAHIEPVRTIKVMLAQAIPLANALTTRSTFNGQGCSIAIVDTGIDYTHPKLGGDSFPNTKVIGGYDFGDGDTDPMPVSSAHGTCCAGIAAGSTGTVGDYIGGVAYGAKLYALKISTGSDDDLDADAALSSWDWCISHKDDNEEYPIRVISNSWGDSSQGFDNEEDADVYAPSFTTAVKKIVEAGITILASSGNEYRTTGIAWPSAMSNVISVGAVYDTTGKVTSYSNTAENLDILAPADPVYTTDIVGSAGYDTGDYYDSFNGTSSACPFAAGCVAALQSAAISYMGEPLTPAQVENVLETTGISVTDTKVSITKPMVNLATAISVLSSSDPVYMDDESCTIVGIAQDADENWTVQGSSNISADPNFILGYYLSNEDAGQEITSVCVDAGSIYSSLLNLDTYTTRTDGIVDAANTYVDMGYHYNSGLTVYDLTIDTNTVDANGTTDPLPGTHKKYDGEEVEITAITDVNSRVAKWIIDGTDVITNVKTKTVTMNKAHKVTVVFEEYTSRSIVVPDQYDTIQEAIDASESGDVIYIYPKSDGTPHYIEDACGIDFGGRSITIRSKFPDDPNIVAETIIDCNNRGRAFIFRNAEDANSIIEGLTITNGLAAGEIATGTTKEYDPEDANIYYMNGNDASGNGYGGAIYVGEKAGPTIRKCVFTNCQATGGIGSDGGTGYSLPSDSSLERGGTGGTGGDGTGNGFGGVIFCDESSSPRILDCTFTDNAAKGGVGGDGGNGGDGNNGKIAGDGGDGGNGSGNGYGGAIYCSAKSKAKIAGCSFSENLGTFGTGGIGGLQGVGKTATEAPYPYDGSSGTSSGTGFGGAIYYEETTTADINDCQILNNIASATTGSTLGSGGGAVYFEPNCVSATIIDSTLSGNQATAGLGGAIVLGARNKLTLEQCYLGGNTSVTNGGAIAVGSKSDANTCNLVFTNCVFTNNTATELGGSIYAKNTDANMVDCFINRNTAYSGGGLYFVSESTLRVVGGTLISNTANGSEGQGGGAMIMHLPAEFINCQIMDNNSAYAGGGIMFNGSETADSNVINCLFAKNIATARGGAIVTSLDSSPNIISCTFSQNETQLGGYGGGIFCAYRSSPTIKYCIFNKNKRVAIYENSIDSQPLISYCFFNANFDGDYYDFGLNRTFDTDISDANDRSAELAELNADTEGNNLTSTNTDPVEDTVFRTGSLGDYYLRQKTADYPSDTSIPAIDAGDINSPQLIVLPGISMAHYTTRTDSYLPDDPNNCTYDQGKLDLGFHYMDANEAKTLYLTTLVEDGKGSILPVSGSFYYGTTVELTATPETGWRVKQWTGSDDDSSTDTTNYVVMMTDKTVSVSFEQPRDLFVPAEYTTLQEAIYDSGDGDKIIISPGTYQYYDTNRDYWGVTIDGKNITITSSAPDDPCVVASTIFKASRFIISNVDSSMILDGITIQSSHWYGGDAVCPDSPPSPDGINGGSLLGGAMVISKASPTIRNVRFVDCSAGGGDGSDKCSTGGDGGWAGYAHGGAVGIGSGSSPIFKNCKFIGCYAYGGNGGDGDTSADSPGHGGNWGDPNGTTTSYSDSVLYTASYTWDYADGLGGEGSYAPYWYYSGFGGAVYCSEDTHPVFTDCVFNSNFTVGGTCGISYEGYEAWPQYHYAIDSFGGAVYLAEGSQADFTDCNFVGNFSDTRNQINDSNVVSLYEEEDWTLSDSVISYGGAIYAENAASIPTLKGCIFSNNIACAGGGIYITDSVFHVSETTFNDNIAMIGGGILLVDSNSALSECDFSGNTAVSPAGQGGAIYSASSSSKFYDCQIMDNEAETSGGAAYFTGELEPNMFNCLIAGNTASRDGGGISANWDTQLYLYNCTLSTNEVTGSGFATSFGGGLSCAYEANTKILNSIFWNNNAENGDEIAIGNNYDSADKYAAEVTVQYSNIQGGGAGVFYDQASGCALNGFGDPTTNLYGTSYSSPSFVTRAGWGDYFLAATDITDSNTGQPVTMNMCIDSGSDIASVFHMYKHTTRTDLKLDVADSNVDIGYHYTRTAEILGDFDFDGDVDIADFNSFLPYWMDEDCTFPYYCNGRDFTEDGEVDFKDYAIFAGNYQKTETTPPDPDPMTWAIVPKSASLTSIKMVSTTAVDNSGADVEYYFDCYSGGGNSSVWISSTSYVDTGLTNGVQYGYRVRARDARGNKTGWSKLGYAVAGEDATPPEPNVMTWLSIPTLTDANTVSMAATVATDSCGVQYYFDETTGNSGGDDSGWISTNAYIDYDLEPNTTYTYRVRARDLSYNHNETEYSTSISVTTPAEGEDANDSNSVDTEAPTPNPCEWEVEPYIYTTASYSYHMMTATTATDDSNVYYFFDCVSGGGTDSTWQTDPSYTAGGFWGVTSSYYRYTTMDAYGNRSEWSPTLETQ